jgi:hypothetical protein
MKKLICFRQMSDERKCQRGADDRRTDILPSAQQELPIVFRLKRIPEEVDFLREDRFLECKAQEMKQYHQECTQNPAYAADQDDQPVISYAEASYGIGKKKDH